MGEREVSFISNLGSALFPTPESNEPPHTFRWRQTVAVCIILIGGSQMLQSALIWGFLPVLFGGFATSAGLQDQQDKLLDIRKGQIERSVQDAVEQRCYAQMQGNMPALKFANDAIQKYQDEYIKLTQRFAPEPACDALIVSKR